MLRRGRIWENQPIVDLWQTINKTRTEQSSDKCPPALLVSNKAAEGKLVSAVRHQLRLVILLLSILQSVLF